MKALAIDPGSEQSAYSVIDDDYHPLDFGKVSNYVLTRRLARIVEAHSPDLVAIEWIQNYGMAAGATIFDTARWVGRFEGELYHLGVAAQVELVTRPKVKLHHCHSSKATDANVKQAMKDRFAPGVRNHGKGVDAAPGFFYGFSTDVWEAFQLAVYLIDMKTGVLI